MKSYHYLAPYYDYILKHVDYTTWYLFLRMIMCKYINNPRTVLELGCGTGKFGPKFSMDDYETYGMDKSLEMLKIAKLRAYKHYHVFCGDITCFSLSKTIDFIFSVHDTFNYILEHNDFLKALSCVHNCMNNDSIFLFDLTTEYNIKKNFHKKLLTFQIKGTYIEWYNEYETHSNILYSKLTFTEAKTTFSEEHLQRLYTVDEVIPLIKKSGLAIVDIVGDYTLKPPHEETVMVNFITKRAQ